MRIDRVTAGVQVRKDFGKCFDFYTQKLGLVAIYGDRNGPYASFASYDAGVPFLVYMKQKMLVKEWTNILFQAIRHLQILLQRFSIQRILMLYIITG